MTFFGRNRLIGVFCVVSRVTTILKTRCLKRHLKPRGGLIPLFLASASLLAALALLLNAAYRSGSPVLYTLIGNDCHRSVLGLAQMDISVYPIDKLCPVCADPVKCRPESSGGSRSRSTTRPTIAVFLLFEGIRNPSGPLYTCSSKHDYSIYMLHRTSADRVQQATASPQNPDDASIDWIKDTLDHCRSTGANVTGWRVKVSADLNLVDALNDLLIEAYFDDATWFDVLLPQNVAVARHDRKWSKISSEELAGETFVGIWSISSGSDVSRTFLHRTHYEIFGHFFPRLLTAEGGSSLTLETAFAYLWQVYSAEGLVHLIEGGMAGTDLLFGKGVRDETAMQPTRKEQNITYGASRGVAGSDASGNSPTGIGIRGIQSYERRPRARRSRDASVTGAFFSGTETMRTVLEADRYVLKRCHPTNRDEDARLFDGSHRGQN